MEDTHSILTRLQLSYIGKQLLLEQHLLTHIDLDHSLTTKNTTQQTYHISRLFHFYITLTIICS